MAHAVDPGTDNADGWATEQRSAAAQPSGYFLLFFFAAFFAGAFFFAAAMVHLSRCVKAAYATAAQCKSFESTCGEGLARQRCSS